MRAWQWKYASPYERLDMHRSEYVLLGLAPAQGRPHTPLQIQKLFFLLQEKGKASPSLGESHFEFQPYHFGPYDTEVYSELESLAQQGWVEVSFTPAGLRQYRLTPEGQDQANPLLQRLDAPSREFVEKTSQWIRERSFSQILQAIYWEFPHMAQNSVFRR